MNIVIVCSNGMTSNVFANKLNQISKEKGLDYSFSATGIFRLNTESLDCDVIFITPHIKSMETYVLEFCEEQQIPYFYLTPDEFNFQNLKESFEAIDQHLQSLQIQSSTTINHPLTRSEIKELGVNTLGLTLTLLIVGQLFNFFYTLTNWNGFFLLSSIFLDVISIYVVLSLGFQFGKKKGENPLTFGLISLGCILLFSPFDQRNPLNLPQQITLTDAYLELHYFQLPYLPIYLLLLFAMLPLFSILYRQTKRILHSYTETLGKAEYLISFFPGFIIFSFVLLLRLLLSSLLF